MGPPFRVGRVIGRSFEIWLRHLPLLFALVLVVHVPYIAWDTYRWLHVEDGGDFELPPRDPSVLELLAYLTPTIARYGRSFLVGELFTRLSQATVIFAVYRRLRREAPSFRGSLRGALHRFWPVLRVTLALFAIEFVLDVALWVSWYVIDWPYEFVPYSFYAQHALILVLMTPFWVAVPAAVIDHDRSLLARSWSLTRGCRLRIFAIVVLVAALGYARYYLVDPVLADLPLPAVRAMAWAQRLLFTSLAAVLAVVGYRALRLNKEGVDVTRLEEIFA